MEDKIIMQSHACFRNITPASCRVYKFAMLVEDYKYIIKILASWKFGTRILLTHFFCLLLRTRSRENFKEICFLTSCLCTYSYMAIPVMKFSISRDLTVYPQFIQFDATNEHVPNLVFTNTLLPFKCLYNTTGYVFFRKSIKPLLETVFIPNRDTHHNLINCRPRRILWFIFSSRYSRN